MNGLVIRLYSLGYKFDNETLNPIGTNDNIVAVYKYKYIEHRNTTIRHETWY